MIVSQEQRRRGRPRGPSLRHQQHDRCVLAQVADCILAKPQMPLAKAIRTAGVTGDSTIRRLQRRWKEEQAGYLSDARRRAASLSGTQAAPMERSRQGANAAWLDTADIGGLSSRFFDSPVHKMLAEQNALMERIMGPSRLLTQVFEPIHRLERAMEPFRRMERILEQHRKIEKALKPFVDMERLTGVRLLED